MATLIVARTAERAREKFEALGLDESDGSGHLGYYGHSYGNRYDVICFVDWPELSDRMWAWISRGVLGRLAPEGEMIFR